MHLFLLFGEVILLNSSLIKMNHNSDFVELIIMELRSSILSELSPFGFNSLFKCNSG